VLKCSICAPNITDSSNYTTFIEEETQVISRKQNEKWKNAQKKSLRTP